jgi:hypothetical protein
MAPLAVGNRRIQSTLVARGAYRRSAIAAESRPGGILKSALGASAIERRATLRTELSVVGIIRRTGRASHQRFPGGPTPSRLIAGRADRRRERFT